MYNSANARTSDIDAINSNDRIAETLYSLGTWVVSRIYVCINTLHKGDNDDDDDDDDNNNNNNNNNLDEKLVNIEQAYRWLKSGDVKGETESTIVAAQDQAISTNYFKNKIFKEEIESECRLCKQLEETIDHLTSGCPILAKNEYLMRHDKVCSHLRYSICKALGIQTIYKRYTHTHAQASV